MLKTMRNNFKSYRWTLWLVILAFVAGFIFFSGIGDFNRQFSESDLLHVGSEVIKGEEYQQLLSKTLDNYRQQMGNNFNINYLLRYGIPEQILQGMVTSTIIKAEAKAMNIRISDEEVRQYIINFPQFQRDGRFIGREEYESLLLANHMRPKEFEKGVREDLLQSKLQEVLTAGAVITEKELQEMYRKEKDKADISYISLGLDRVKEPITVSDDEVKTHYEQNKNRYMSKEKRSGYVMAFKLADLRKEIKLKEEDIYTYFEKNKNQYKIPGRTKVSRILMKFTELNRDEILKKANALKAELTPQNFAAKAMELSEDEKAGSGGDWGENWHQFTMEEQNKIARMGANTISDPMLSGSAFAILMVTEKIPDAQQPYDTAKASIRAILENEETRRLANERANRIYGKLKDSKDIKLDAPSDAPKVQETGFLAINDPLKGVDESGEVARALFVGKELQVLAPIETYEGVVIVQMRAVRKPEVESLETARARVKTDVETLRKIEVLKTDAARILKAWQGENDEKKIEEWTKKENLKVEKTDYHHEDQLAGSFAPKGTDEAIFALEAGAYAAPIACKDKVVLVRLNSKTVTGEADFRKEKDSFAQSKIEQLKNTLFRQYIVSRSDRYPLKVNQPLFEKIKDSVISRFH